MFCFRLPVRALASRHLQPARFVRAALTYAWVFLAFWLLAAGSTITSARSSANAGQQVAYGQNQAPQIQNFHAFYQGDGVWLFCGQVRDESPIGMTVELSGAPLAETLYVTVQPSGAFCRSSFILGYGVVFANTTDAQGLAAPETFAVVGF